jgi:CBS-domain-containing membrane protein
VNVTLRTRLQESRPLAAAFAALAGGLAIGSLALIAHATGKPAIFPSLGPTACLFFWFPQAPAAAPRNVLVGHSLGVVAGWLSLWAFGLLDHPGAFLEGVSVARSGAVATALGATSGLMVLLKTPHPPAGATTLLVALGVLKKPEDLGVVLLAVLALTVEALIVHRLLGLGGTPPASSARP